MGLDWRRRHCWVFRQDLELLARQRHVLDNACLTLKTHSLAGNLDLFYLFGSICICWKVIWAFFEVHLPATFVVDRLEYKWIRTQETKNFWAETASHEGEWQGLSPLYLWSAHDWVKWDEKENVPDKFTKTFTQNVRTFRYAPQTFLKWVKWDDNKYFLTNSQNKFI